MKFSFIIPFNSQLTKASLDVHDDIYLLLKKHNPKAEFFREHPELMQVYLNWMLIKSGQLQTKELEGGSKNLISLELTGVCPTLPG